METEVKVNVTAFSQIGKDETFYDGTFYNERDYGPGLTDCLEYNQLHGPGFFNSLEQTAEAIYKGLKEITEDLNPKDRQEFKIIFTSEILKSNPPSPGYIDSTGAYTQRPLTESQLTALIAETDRKIRPELYQ